MFRVLRYNSASLLEDALNDVPEGYRVKDWQFQYQSPSGGDRYCVTVQYEKIKDYRTPERQSL